MKNIFFLLFLLSSVTATHILEVQSETAPEAEDLKNGAFYWLKHKVITLANSLKNPPGPDVNPHNRCIWKICSKPLKARQPDSMKEFKISKKVYDKILADLKRRKKY